jgi:hypothetical protein
MTLQVSSRNPYSDSVEEKTGAVKQHWHYSGVWDNIADISG